MPLWPRKKKPDIDPVLLKNILSEYGAWDDSELSDHAKFRTYFLDSLLGLFR